MTEINRNLKIIDVGCNATIPAEDIFEKIDNFTEILRNSNCRAITGSDVVFISIERGLDAIVAVIACLRLELVFTFCPPASDTDDVVRKFRTTLVFNGKHVSRIAQNDENGLLAAESICYVIQTSGTTGAKKQVAVPVDCIRKNIEHFCSLFNLTSSDSILFSTSLHFDPSIVELFMAFHVGCTLIITPDEYRSEPHKLQKSIDKFQPTVVQLTPTVFEMLPSADSLLSATSSLRILLLGGSHFPISSINSCRSPENKTRVFNVYGVTEVSCWASYFEVEHGCSEVLIGEAIYGTQLGVDSDGQLILGGPRQCYVDGVKALNHKTGDRVEVTENGGQKIVGRIDRLIKHRGIRICLDHLSHVALRHDPSIQSLHTMLLDNRNIVQFHVGPGSSSPTHKTLRLDATTVVPITVIQVAELPINSSGKVDEKALERIYGKVSGGGNSKFQEIFEQKLKVKLSEVLDVSFVSLGVNSLLAAELSTFFQVSQQTEVMRRMLNETVPVGDVLRKFELSPKLQSHVDFEVRKIIRKRQPKMRWAVDLRKCIDGNLLVICNTLVVCASHAGIVIAVNPQTGNLIWRAECGVRFECKPILVNDQVVLGCKSTGLYFICVKTGQIQNSVILETVGVRAQCAFDGGAIYCTTENGNFHVIDPKTYGSIYSHAISKIPGGTSVGPVIAPDGSIFATITAGAVLRTTKNPYSSTEFGAATRFGPIFAEPLFVGSSVIITTVHGVLTSFDVESGRRQDQISLENENCFCAPLPIANSHLLVATQSGTVLHVSLSPKLSILSIFRFDLPSPGISYVKTPKFLRRSCGDKKPMIMMTSKSGWLILAEISENGGELQNLEAIPISNKEIFTSPEIIDNVGRGGAGNNILLIAGRDDYLRAWDFDTWH